MTRNLKDLIKKSFVFTLVAIFTLSSVNTGWTQTPANLSPIQHFSIPDSLGNTTDSFVPLTGRTTPLLIHIEDAHAHFATQSKIREILNYLHRQYGVNTVFIEGASGKINTEFFNIFPDSKLNVNAAERWMKEGQFSGAEVFGIENGSSVNLQGVENQKLYSENLREFRETHQLFGSSETVLNEWNSRLKQIKAKIYLGDLKKWDESADQFASEKIDVLAYGHVLKNLAEKYQIAPQKFPHLKKLFDLEDACQSISINEWRKEWDSVRNFIVSQIPDSDSAKKMLLENWDFLKGGEFVIRDKKMLLAKEPRLYFEILVTAGERYGYSFKDVKALPNIARFLISQKEIASSELFSEISDLELRLGDKLIETHREREVYEIDCSFRHLNRLFHLAVNRNEWNQIRANQKKWNPSALHPRIQKLENEIFRSPKTLSRINDALLSHALNFYRLAYSREDVLVQNSLKQMTEANVSKAVLITGGFHSDGIRAKLKKADFSYLSIHPSVVESGEESRYLEIMLGRRNVLPEFYFAHSKINSLAVPAQLPHPARLIFRTVLESGPVISQSQSFREAFGRSFNRLARIGALDGVFPSNPISAEVGGTAEDLKIFLETAENEAIVLDIPSDSSKVPSIEIAAKSLGSKRHKLGKGTQSIDISKIAIWGFGDAMKTTAAALAGREVSKGKAVHVDIYDYERNIKSTELQNHEGDRQPVYDKAKADGFITTHFIEEFPDAEQASKNIQSWQLKALRENSIVLIDPGAYPSDGSLEFYENYIAERAQGFGKALYLLRQSGDFRPRVFAIRNQVRAHLTEEVMQIILNAYKDESKKSGGDYSYDTDFTVVHVPDLSRGGQQMQDMETQKIIFGFPDLKNIITKDVLKKNPRAIKEFRSVERKAEIALRDLFIHSNQGKDHYLKINARSAELAPFGTQLDLFTKLLTFNTFSQLVHALGGDMEKVSIGTGLDYRIGLHFTKVAFGIGGRARKFIESTMTRLSPMLKKWIETLREANKDQIKWFQKIIEDTLSSHFGLHELSNQEIAVLGVAYKSKNGSLMGSPALDLISWLIEKRVSKIYICDPYVDPDEFLREIGRMKEVEQDPVRKDALQRALRLNIFEFEKNPLEAIQKSKAAIIATDHPEFKSLTPEAIAEATKGENGEEDVPLFDGRNLFSPVAMGKAGVNYISIGRQPVGPKFGPTKDWDAIENVAFDKNRTGMKVAMIGGTGYVAQTTGARIAESGHYVTSLEVQANKVEKLNQQLEQAAKQKLTKGIDIGIHEPGLDEVIIRNYKAGRLKYVPSYDDKNLNKFVEGDPATDALAEAEVVYIGVGTPEGINGEANLNYILGATRAVGHVLKNIIPAHPDDPKYPKRKVIVVKSTVPPVAFEEMKRVLEKEFGLKEEVDFDLASNPEFLREGQAWDDVSKPVRTVLGVKSAFAAKVLRELWASLEKEWPHKVLITDVVTAPLIKYLSNVFLAISISFVNALAWYAQDEGASITQIVQAMKSDHRISSQAIKVLMKLLEPSHKERFTKFFEEKKLNPDELDHLPAGWEHWPAEIKQYCKISAFLGPGIGWGGSCFPKDLKAAKYQYEQVLKRKFGIIDTTIEINDFAPERVYRDIVKFLDKHSTGRQDVPLKGKKITVLGAAFKGDTDDVRETRTLPFVLRLLDGGAEVTVHDPHPKAMANIKALFAETIFYSKTDNPLIAKIRLKPEVAEFKAQLQKAGLKIMDSEAQPLISEFLNKIFGTSLTFVTNPDFKGDKNMTDDEKREETKKEMKVIAESVVDSDMVVVVTDWEVFKHINLKLIFKKMTRSRYSSGAAAKKSPIIFDARNLLTNRDAVSRRFILLQVGERPLFPENRKTSDSSLGKVPNGDSSAPVAEEAAPEGPTTQSGGPSVDASSLGKKTKASLTDEQVERLGRWEFLKPLALNLAVFALFFVSAGISYPNHPLRDLVMTFALFITAVSIGYFISEIWQKDLIQFSYAVRKLTAQGDFENAARMTERLIHSSHFDLKNKRYGVRERLVLEEVFEDKNFQEAQLIKLLKAIKTRYSFQFDVPEETRKTLEDFYKDVIQKSPHQSVRDQAARYLAELPKKKIAQADAEHQPEILEQILKKDPQHRISKAFLGKPHLIRLLEIMYKWVPGRTDEQKLKETSDYFRANRRAIQAEAEKLNRTNIRGALFGHVLIEPQFDDDNALVEKSGGGLESLLTGNRREITREEDLSLKSTYYSLAGPSEIQSIKELLSSKGASLGEQDQPNLKWPERLDGKPILRELFSILMNDKKMRKYRGVGDFVWRHQKQLSQEILTLPEVKFPDDYKKEGSFWISSSAALRKFGVVKTELWQNSTLLRDFAERGESSWQVYKWNEDRISLFPPDQHASKYLLLATKEEVEAFKQSQAPAASLGTQIDLKSIEVLVEKSPTIKAFVFNVAGTLVDEKTKSPSPQMLIALAKLVNRGKRVILLWGDRKSLKDQGVESEPIITRAVDYNPAIKFPKSAIPHWINEEEPYNLIKLIHPDKRDLLWFLPYFNDSHKGAVRRAEVWSATRSGNFGYRDGQGFPEHFLTTVSADGSRVAANEVVYVGSEFENVTHSYFDAADVKDFFSVNVGANPASLKVSEGQRIFNLHGGPEGTQAFLDAVIKKIDASSLGKFEIPTVEFIRDVAGFIAPKVPDTVKQKLLPGRQINRQEIDQELDTVLYNEWELMIGDSLRKEREFPEEFNTIFRGMILKFEKLNFAELKRIEEGAYDLDPKTLPRQYTRDLTHVPMSLWPPSRSERVKEPRYARIGAVQQLRTTFYEKLKTRVRQLQPRIREEIIRQLKQSSAASLGFYISNSAKKLVAEWADSQMIYAGQQFASSVIVQPADISPDARVAAGRIFASAKNSLPGELVIPVEAQSDESLLKILEPIALQLRGESKKDVSIFTTSALKSKIESVLKSLKVDAATIHDYVHFKSSHESLDLYLIGRTAKFGEGRVVLIGDSGIISNVAVPGVRKISRDQVRSGQSTQDIQQKDRLVAQVAAIDLGLDLLSASEWIPQQDKLQQDGNMLFMKEDFFTQYAEKWIAQMHAQMAILIAA